MAKHTSVSFIGQLCWTAGQRCIFSFWGSSGSSTHVPLRSLRIDGTDVGTALTATDSQWASFSCTCTPTASGWSAFSTVDLNGAGCGNDGAIDDIPLTAPVPEPTGFGLMRAGPAGVAALRRRHQR